MKNEAILSRWHDFENAREEFLSELKSWNMEDLSKSPASGWSAVKVLEHIITAERGTLGYMKKKSSGGWETLESTGEDHVQASVAVNARLKSPERYQAPSVLAEPTGEISFDELKRNWDQLRDDLKDFIQAVDPVYHNKLVFRQPVAGMLNLLQAMEFMTHHVRHHIPQLHRIKAEIE